MDLQGKKTNKTNTSAKAIMIEALSKYRQLVIIYLLLLLFHVHIVKIKAEEDKQKQNNDNDECQIYLAESSIPNAGFGMYTASEIKKDEDIGREIKLRRNYYSPW